MVEVVVVEVVAVVQAVVDVWVLCRSGCVIAVGLKVFFGSVLVEGVVVRQVVMVGWWVGRGGTCVSWV